MPRKQQRKSLSMRSSLSRSKAFRAKLKKNEDVYLKEIEQLQNDFLKRVHVIVLESSRNEDSYSTIIESRRGIVVR